MDLKLIGVTVALGVGLSIILALAFRATIASSWDESRCKPGVIALAALFKPTADPRTGAEFAKDNWSFCQKQYIETALKTATSSVKQLSESQGSLVAITSTVVDGMSSTFTALWSMCHKAFAIFMERFSAAAKLMRNIMINMYSIVDRLQGVVFSVAMALVSLITAFISTVQVVLMVSVIIIAIILIMQILLFYLFAPISGLVITVTALVAATVVIATAAIAAAMINDACFTGDTEVMTVHGPRPIRTIQIGDILSDGGRVTATHIFKRVGPLYDIDGIKVSGDHLYYSSDGLTPVRQHPRASRIESNEEVVYCLTTTTRTIPVNGKTLILFADWEEIPDGDPSLRSWYSKVFEHLNGITPLILPDLDSEAGFSPDSILLSKNGPVIASAVKIGDELVDGTVLGIVTLEEQPTVNVEGQEISKGTWIFRDSLWIQPKEPSVHKRTLIHLYTSSGIITLGNLKIRDASEIGLDKIGKLVDTLILKTNHQLG